MNKENLPNGAMLELTNMVCACMCRITPRDFQRLFVPGLLMNVVGNMTEEYWEEFQGSCCDDEDCDPCRLAKEAIPVLKLLRDRFLVLRAMTDIQIKTMPGPMGTKANVFDITKIAKRHWCNKPNEDQSFST